MIYVYADNVFDNRILLERLRRQFDIGAVNRCNAEDIKNGMMDPENDVLVMPGGADIYFCQELEGEGNQAIRRFVSSGGRYLGICAGAYYASSKISWAANTNAEISGSRELALIDCHSVGPVEEFIAGLRKNWCRAVNLGYQNNVVPVLYFGGPVFKDIKDAEILARYEELPGSPPAVIGKEYGKGYVVLCSPHLEIDGEAFARMIYEHRYADSWNRDVEKNLRKHNKDQERAWKWLMGQIIPAMT